MERFKAAKLHGKEILNVLNLLMINRFSYDQKTHLAYDNDSYHSSTNICRILRDVNNAEWVIGIEVNSFRMKSAKIQKAQPSLF